MNNTSERVPNHRSDVRNIGASDRLVDSVDRMVRLPFQMTGATWDFMKDSVQRGTTPADAGDRLVDSVDRMARLPLEMSGATWDLVMEGVQRMTGSRPQGDTPHRDPASWTSAGDHDTHARSTRWRSWTDRFTVRDDQDLGGDDLKYVVWSIVFTKPGLESVLEPQREQLVSYDADGPTFAAATIADFFDRARQGHVDKPESWHDDYPSDEASSGERKSVRAKRTHAHATDHTERETASGPDAGWQIPPEDRRYVTVLYRVDRRLPRQEEVKRVERTVAERETASH